MLWGSNDKEGTKTFPLQLRRVLVLIDDYSKKQWKNLLNSSNKTVIYRTKNALFLMTAFECFSTAFSSKSSVNPGTFGVF